MERVHKAETRKKMTLEKRLKVHVKERQRKFIKRKQCDVAPKEHEQRIQKLHGINLNESVKKFQHIMAKGCTFVSYYSFVLYYCKR